MSEEKDKIKAILEQNKGKDFVQRIQASIPGQLDPDNSPSMDLGKGWTGTHMMAADIDDETGKWMVYPTIVRIDGELKQLEVNEALLHAKATGEYIDFGNDKAKAIAFSKDYKKVWEND